MTILGNSTSISSATRGPRSIPEVLLERAERTPDELFLRCGDVQLTFGETTDRAERIAGALHAAGVEPGDRVAVLSPNRPEVLELLFGCARLGAIQVPINAFLKGQFLRYQLEDSEAQALVVDAVGYRAVAPLLDQVPGLRRLVLLDPVDASPGSDVVAYGELLDGRPTCQAPIPNADAVMTIGYTSGTTGAPKGCILTHGYYLRVAARMEDAWELTGDDRLITALPLFHGGARMMVVATALQKGIAVAVEREFSPAAFLDTAASSNATVAFGVGAMGMALLGTPPSPADRAHALRLVMWVPFSPEHQRQFEERFGASVLAEGYGQTECVPVSYSRVSGVRRRATAGVPAPDLEVRLVDEDDVDVAPGIPGEIVLRPRTPHAMFSGYWRKPDATLTAYRNLWYHTGDYGKCDEDGFISFVDRKKDALRRRGENVSSLELEAAIAAHPKIAEASVHAIPSDLTEDDIKACLVLVPGASVEPAELFDFLKGNLPYFAIPRYVEILPELPKNATARVMKHLLRERAITESTWDFDALGLTISRSERR